MIRPEDVRMVLCIVQSLNTDSKTAKTNRTKTYSKFPNKTAMIRHNNNRYKGHFAPHNRSRTKYNMKHTTGRIY